MQNNKHSANRLTYALNATGKLVYIDEVPMVTNVAVSAQHAKSL